MIKKLDATLEAYWKHMDASEPHLAFNEVYIFILRDICDTYLVKICFEIFYLV